MNLSQVPYKRCECGKSYPLASITNAIRGNNATISKKVIESDYTLHNNPRCQPCMRKSHK